MPQPWPTAGDYAEALQNPHLCFTDPQLQGGVVDKKLMGTPCGSDGNSAIVFELRCASETYAIKCFKRPAPDRQQHYNELSQRLSVLSSPLLMKEFVFLQDAISIRGEWFPILKMERVNPNQLGFHVDKCLSQGTSLLPLAESFRNMMRDIETLSIVHGDLQHGNVLIEKNGTLKLIDYDGTCVLPWQGATPQERGHPNYQHPERATFKAGLLRRQPRRVFGTGHLSFVNCIGSRSKSLGRILRAGEFTFSPERLCKSWSNPYLESFGE